MCLGTNRLILFTKCIMLVNFIFIVFSIVAFYVVNHTESDKESLKLKVASRVWLFNALFHMVNIIMLVLYCIILAKCQKLEECICIKTLHLQLLIFSYIAFAVIAFNIANHGQNYVETQCTMIINKE